MSESVTEYIEPNRLAESVTHKFAKTGTEISAYWVQIRGDREAYAADVQRELRDLPIAVLIVRDISFTNPNAVAMDLIGIIEANREVCQSRIFPDAVSLHFGVVLLSRTPLTVPQTSSPIRLPGWFPVRGGETAMVIVEDLTWTADAPLNCYEAKVDEICEALYALEGVIIERMHEVNRDNHNAGNALMEIIRCDAGEKYAALVAEFIEHHRRVPAPSGFRPSLREGHSVIARLWGVVQSRPPEALHGPGKAVAAALGLSGNFRFGPESIVAVLSRPSSRDATEGGRFARSLLVTIASACQFITAAAHAGEYGRYPIQLLVSISFDLRRSLTAAEHVLRE